MTAFKAIVSVCALIGLLAAMASAVNIATVPVGNPGNAGELSGAGAGGFGPDRICGSVAYDYRIGTHEVTAGQYAEFLNKVGGVDTYGLYNTGMSNTSYGSGIARTGGGTVGNPYTYSVAADFVNRPVNYVSYWDSCRFTNWLNNGQPTGAQGAGTTERGAYTLDGYNGNDGRTIQRNANWKWAVTSEDEWYKAAYYKGGSTNAGYFDYPTSSDTAPGQDMADVSGNNANYYTAPYVYPIDSGKYTTVGGEFQNSDSPYGTFDQGGNVFEWNEAVLYGSFRGLRGGSYYYHVVYLRASGRSSDTPTYEDVNFGFRVVEVPEPGSAALALLGALGLFGRRSSR
jgi:formylglycine-generating enzyme required for sulfatase activity